MTLTSENPNRVPGYEGKDFSKMPGAPATAAPGAQVPDGFTPEYSGTEVDHLRQPGQLVFSTDNEIMSVEVKAGENIRPGDVVAFDGDYAIVADPANFDSSTGFGVCIHEGFDNRAGFGPNTDGGGLVQIATGNAYVICTAATGGIKPFTRLRLAAGGASIARNEAGHAVPASNRLTAGASGFTTVDANADGATTAAAINRIQEFLTETVGRFYGIPGGQVRPQPSTTGGVIVVRLGAD